MTCEIIHLPVRSKQAAVVCVDATPEQIMRSACARFVREAMPYENLFDPQEVAALECVFNALIRRAKGAV